MSFDATSLLGVIASISSMNKMHGAELCGGGQETRVREQEDHQTTQSCEQNIRSSFSEQQKRKRASRVWSSFGTLLTWSGMNISLNMGSKKGRTDHSQVEELSQLLLGLPRNSRHHLRSRNLQHGQLQLLARNTGETFMVGPAGTRTKAGAR